MYLPESVSRFTEGLIDSYPPFIPYLILQEGPELLASSSRAFRQSRENLVERLLVGQAIQEQMSQALALEHFVNLALRIPLEGSGFIVGLTPQSLEKSEKGHKGVDLIITDENNLVYLGIDVKLRKGHSVYKRDGYGWNQRLLSPYIYLSLGNFSVNMRERSDVSVLDWLSCVLSKVGTSGKIPHLDQFRSYLVTRIERSINGCLERIREPDLFTHARGLPETVEELLILEEKLAIMQSLFFDLRQNS